MLKKILLCFMILCSGLIVTFFICFRLLILPRYNEHILKEAQLSTNMLSGTLLNTVERSINAINAEIINNHYNSHNLPILAAVPRITYQDALDTLRFLDGKIDQFGMFYSVDIYFERSATVLSSAFGLQTLEGGSTETLFPWLFSGQLSDQPPGEQRIHSDTITFYEKPVELISFSQMLRLPVDGGYARCVVNYSLKQTELLGMLGLLQKPGEGILLLSDRGGNVIRLTGEDLADWGEEGLADELKGNDSLKLGGDSFLICHASEEERGFSVLKLIPIATIADGSRDLNRIFLFALALILLASLLFGYFASVRLSLPVLRLVAQIKRKYEGDANEKDLGGGKNELGFLAQTVQSLFCRVDTLESALAENQLIARNHLLTGLIKGTVSGDDAFRRMELCELQFPHERFTVLRIRLEKSLFRQLDPKEFQLVRVGLIDRLSREMNEQLRFYPVEADEHVVYAIVSFGEIDFSVPLASLFGQMTEDCKFPPGAVTISVGRSTSSLDELHLSCRDAGIAEEYRFLYPGQELFFYDWTVTNTCLSQIPEACAAAFSAALHRENPLEMLAAIHDILRFIRQSSFDPVRAREELASLASRTAVLLDDSVLNKTKRENWIAFSFSDITVFEQEVEDLRDAVDTRREDVRENRREILLQAVSDYIDANLDKPLSLGEAAKQVYISPAYLSKVFKDASGVNFNEYVNSRKMEFAKKALLSTSDSVETISQRLGFASSNYFIKRFKQYTGYTPTAYRTFSLANELKR